MMILAGLAAAAAAFGISFLGAFVAARVAGRVGMMDVPGGHKAHGRAVPLLGGCAIFLGVLLPSSAAIVLALYFNAATAPGWIPTELAVHVAGAARKVPTALGILGAAMVLHVMGLIDDRKHLGAWPKLAVQVLVAAAVVVFCNVRILTAIGTVPSVAVSIIWLVAITNAFNFMDNMDGLSAGVAAICAAGLLGASAGMGQVFVSAWLCLLLGSLAGFLPHNFPPAKIFMGDAGSLVVGFLLGVMSCLTTYVRPGQTYYLYGAFMPLVMLAVPLYDMVSVIALRIRQGLSPMAADRRHFSHRLVRRGMKPRAAVLTIYLCTLATAISASLLGHVHSNVAAAMVFAQTLVVLLLVAVLESGGAK